jgi:tetratricopeptide (TPR) repeat protein
VDERKPALRGDDGRGRSSAALLLVLLVALFHGPSLKHGFVYDDAWTVLANPFLRDARNLASLLGAGPSRAGVPDAGRPTLLATELLDHALWGLSPGGFHLQNLLWHALVTLLLFFGLRRLTGTFLVPLTASAIFAVHPLNVEAVAAINYREDLLAAAFVLLALLAIAAARDARAGRALALRAGGILALLIGLLAKENASVAPLWLAAIDLYREPGPARPILRRHLRDYLSLTVTAATVFAWRWWVIGAPASVSRSVELSEHHLWSAVPAAARAFLAGVCQLVMPLGLSPEYADPARGAAGVLWCAGAVVLLGAGVALAIRLRGRAPWIGLGIIAGVIAYLPNFGLVPLTNLRADRYFYLPSLGLCLAAAAIVVGGLERVRRVREATFMDLPGSWLAVALLVFVLGMRSLHQGRIWASDLTLWRHATAIAPSASRAWLNLASAELHAGQTVEALRDVDRSLALEDDVHARELRALVLLAQGDPLAASAELSRLVAAPALSDAYRAQLLNNLGFVEQRLHRSQQAIERFRQAEALAPRFELPALNRARVLAELQQVAEAESVLRGLLGRVPESSEAWRQLGQLLEAQGRADEAAAALEHAKKLAPQLPAARAFQRD